MFVEKLLSIASFSSIQGTGFSGQLTEMPTGARFDELFSMLSVKNGFFAFEGALHVLPWIAPPSQYMSIQVWNDSSLWRGWYQDQTDGLFFFAEDVFGGQFAIKEDQIVSFDPESGEIEVIAQSIEEWASKLLLNYDLLTGFSAAHSWQLTHGPIPEGKRLLPKRPFILGGAYEESNLFAIDAVKGMQYRGELWQQIRDLPDGAQIRLKALPLQ